MSNTNPTPVTAAQTQQTTPNYSSNSNLSTSTAVFLAMFELMAKGIELNNSFMQAAIKEANASFKGMISSANLEAIASYIQAGAAIAGDTATIGAGIKTGGMYKEARLSEAANPGLGGAGPGQGNAVGVDIEARNPVNAPEQGAEIEMTTFRENEVGIVERTPQGGDRGFDIEDGVEQNNVDPRGDENEVRINDARETKTPDEIRQFFQTWQSVGQLLQHIGQFIATPFTAEAKHLQAMSQRIEKLEQANKSAIDQNNQNVAGAAGVLSAASNARTAGSAR